MRSVGTAVLGLCALIAIFAGGAGATGGGGSIASAPVAPAGVQQLGNTSSFTDSCQNKYEFWKLQLKQGDLVKITWAAPPAVDTLALWPAGTTDAANDGCLYASGWSHWTVGPILSDNNGTAATSRVSQTVAPANGSYPLVFLDTTGAQNAGAYSFTANVLHAASVALPPVSAVYDSGQLAATVLAPDSSPITDSTLKLTLNGFWSTAAGAPPTAHKLGTATPSNGAATFSYRVPLARWGKRIGLEITGSGSSYQAVKSQTESVKVLVPASIAPVVLRPSQLKTMSRTLGQPIYWAGRQRGHRYEFTRTTNGYLYVRYLPHGARAGAHGSSFLIVATYPFPGAYAALKNFAKGKVVAGPHGSIFYIRPNSKSVLVAFPKVNDEIEVYDPNPKVARAIVVSGRLRPVR